MIVRRNLVATVVTMLVTAVLLGVGVLSFQHGTAAVKPVVLPFDSFWCAKDDDCVVVDRIGCCPCSAGGAQGAVTRWHTDELRLFLKSACRPRPVCIDLDLCRNDVRAVCEDSSCRLIPDPSRPHGQRDSAATRGAKPPRDGAPQPDPAGAIP